MLNYLFKYDIYIDIIYIYDSYKVFWKKYLLGIFYKDSDL